MSVFDRLRRKKPSAEESREQEENRVRAAAELRRAEQDSERSRA
jgi:hypothetical protein